MRVLKPTILKPGDVIGVCAPASALEANENLERGIRYLERNGYRIKLGKNLLRKHGYFAGTDAQRASDINDLFADPQVKAIFVARGGYGSHRILSLLDYRRIKQNPKILVGYSDITALQLGLFAKTGLVTFSGPMVASDLGRKLTPEAEDSFWKTLTSASNPAPITCATTLSSGPNTVKRSVGRILGGNLSLIAALVGTGYFPDIRNLILLLEEIDERPYRIDRLLQQINLAGILDRATGIALGKFINCAATAGKPSLTLDQVFQETFSGFRYPVLSGFDYGHTKSPLTIPIGIRASLSTHSRKIGFLEPAVQE